MINKNKFRIKDIKKVMHKVGKRWVIASAIVLSLAASGAMTATHTHAETNVPVQVAINKENRLKQRAADEWNDAWTQVALNKVNKHSSTRSLKGLGKTISDEERSAVNSAGSLDKAYAVMPNGKTNHAYDNYVQARRSAGRLASSAAKSYTKSNNNGRGPISPAPKHIDLDDAVSEAPHHRNSKADSIHKKEVNLVKTLKGLNKQITRYQRSVSKAKRTLKRAHTKRDRHLAIRNLKKTTSCYQASVKRFDRTYPKAVKLAYQDLLRSARHGSYKTRKKAQRLLSRLNHKKRAIHRMTRSGKRKTKRYRRNLAKAKKELAKLETSLIK